MYRPRTPGHTLQKQIKPVETARQRCSPRSCSESGHGCRQPRLCWPSPCVIHATSGTQNIFNDLGLYPFVARGNCTSPRPAARCAPCPGHSPSPAASSCPPPYPPGTSAAPSGPPPGPACLRTAAPAPAAAPAAPAPLSPPPPAGGPGSPAAAPAACGRLRGVGGQVSRQQMRACENPFILW